MDEDAIRRDERRRCVIAVARISPRLPLYLNRAALAIDPECERYDWLRDYVDGRPHDATAAKADRSRRARIPTVEDREVGMIRDSLDTSDGD